MGKKGGSTPKPVSLEEWLKKEPARVPMLERDYPEAAEKCRTYARVMVAGDCKVSIPQFKEAILVPLGCQVSTTTVRDYIRRCVRELGE